MASIGTVTGITAPTISGESRVAVPLIGRRCDVEHPVNSTEVASGPTKTVRRVGRRVATTLVGGLGYDLVRKHYYSPIPDLSSLSPSIWSRRSELAGVQFDPEAGLEFVRRELAPYLAEYCPPREPTSNPRDFYLDNGFYGSVDAETLYAMVRRFEPSRIVELGCGMSTLVIADARARFDREAQTRHLACDPHPRPDLAPTLASVAELRAVSATDVPAAEFAALSADDMLIVDTTHAVKVGGDVNRVILDILPSLAPGVLVHIHDIYLPWEYPNEFVTERRFFWGEQYLLQAFLAFNEQFEVLFGTHALTRRFPDEMSEIVPSLDRAGAGSPLASAFWIRRVLT